jgi:hypothetical protein
MSESIVLVGDSIFDNAIYVPGESCVTEQLRARVREGVDVSMLAVDGDFASDVHQQIKKMPAQATHIFVSAGGNDALRYSYSFAREYSSSVQLFTEWSVIQKEFRDNYRSMLEAVIALERHIAVCTIYDAVPGVDEIIITALSLFNDVITAEAIYAGVPVVDLRWVCTEASDYSRQSPIEPSSQGGAKISEVLNRLFEEHDFHSDRTVVFT